MVRKQIKLLVVDDHAIMREGLVRLLEHESDLKVVGLANNGREAIDIAKQKKADVILLDIVMDDMSGLEAARQILSIQPEIKVVMITMYEEKAFFFDALRAGARGYFLKGSDSNELIHTIRNVHKGGTYLDPKMAGWLVEEYLKARAKLDKLGTTPSNSTEEVDQ